MSKESLLKKLDDNISFNEMLIKLFIDHNNEQKYDNIKQMLFYISRLAAILMYNTVLNDFKEALENDNDIHDAEED